MVKQHSSGFLTLVAQAKNHVKEIAPAKLKECLDKQQPLWLVDVREASEWSEGCIPSAIHLSKGVIERDIEKQIPDRQAPIVVYCSGGFRSTLAAHNLQLMGYANVASLETGLQGWLEAGYLLSK